MLIIKERMREPLLFVDENMNLIINFNFIISFQPVTAGGFTSGYLGVYNGWLIIAV